MKSHRDKHAFVRSFFACVRSEYAGSAALLMGAFSFLPWFMCSAPLFMLSVPQRLWAMPRIRDSVLQFLFHTRPREGKTRLAADEAGHRVAEAGPNASEFRHKTTIARCYEPHARPSKADGLIITFLCPGIASVYRTTRISAAHAFFGRLMMAIVQGISKREWLQTRRCRRSRLAASK